MCLNSYVSTGRRSAKETRGSAVCNPCTQKCTSGLEQQAVYLRGLVLMGKLRRWILCRTRDLRVRFPVVALLSMLPQGELSASFFFPAHIYGVSASERPCVYIYIYIYIYVYICVCVCVCVYACIHVHTQMHIKSCINNLGCGINIVYIHASWVHNTHTHGASTTSESENVYSDQESTFHTYVYTKRHIHTQMCQELLR
jgi:hypothetical protein